MIKLIVGLGNPGQKYQRTRHNVGFLFLDGLLEQSSGVWAGEAKFNALISQRNIAGKKVYLLKPQTFMNRSGYSVGGLARYYKISVEEILVIHDELDFSVGVSKLKLGGGHAGHNGLRDIIANLGGKGFYRLRVGIGRPVSGMPVANYVLSGFSKPDEAVVQSSLNDILSQMEEIVAGDMDLAMNRINQRG